MKKLFCILLLVLSGCATTPQQVVTSTQVQVPVATTCQVAYPAAPTNYMSQVTSADSVLTKGNAAIETMLSYATYSDELLAVLQKCAVDTGDNTNVQQTQPQTK